jgi:hypothetical protein
MRNQLVALAIAVAYPLGAIAATTEAGGGMGTEVKKETGTEAGSSSGAAGAYGSGPTSPTPETKASGAAKGKAKAEAKKPDSGKAPEEMGARDQSSGGAGGEAK